MVGREDELAMSLVGALANKEEIHEAAMVLSYIEFDRAQDNMMCLDPLC